MAFMIRLRSTCWSWTRFPLTSGSCLFGSAWTSIPCFCRSPRARASASSDELVEVERDSLPNVALEVGSNVSNQGSCAMAVRGDSLECLLGLVEVRDRAVKKAQARIGRRDHRSQRLPDLVRDRRRDGVPGHQPGLTLATLSKDRAEQPRIKRLYLVQQDNQDETAGQEPEDPDGIPADAEARRIGVVAQRLVDRRART